METSLNPPREAPAFSVAPGATELGEAMGGSLLAVDELLLLGEGAAPCLLTTGDGALGVWVMVYV